MKNLEYVDFVKRFSKSNFAVIGVYSSEIRNRRRRRNAGEPRYLHFLKTYSGIAAAAAVIWLPKVRKKFDPPYS